MIVTHEHQKQENAYPAAERGRCKRPLIDRNPEYLEYHSTEGDVGQDQQEFHQRSPASGFNSIASPLERSADPKLGTITVPFGAAMSKPRLGSSASPRKRSSDPKLGSITVAIDGHFSTPSFDSIASSR